VPVVAKILSTGPGGDLDRLRHKALGETRMQILSRRFAAFHTLSEEVDIELLDAGVAPERLVRIPNGVDTANFHPPDGSQRLAAREDFGLPARGLVSLYCGRFAPVKRLTAMLEAFSQAPGHLLLLGEGPELEALRAQAAQPALRGRVSFHAPVENPAAAYRAADLYLSTSHTEGMSGSMLEAMASGLAILAAPASGVRDLFADGGGLLAEGDFAAELRDLLADPQRRAQVGERAREVVQERYGLQQTAASLAQLYRRLAA
jgi:glycosyltransferase involved in cell wall biosynthesis